MKESDQEYAQNEDLVEPDSFQEQEIKPNQQIFEVGLCSEM